MSNNDANDVLNDDLELIDSATVERMLNVSRRSIDRWEKDNKFPKRVRISHKTVRWVRSEVLEWRRNRIAQRGEGAQ